MTEPPSSTNVSPMGPNPAEFTRRVRELAANSENVSWSAHAWERMEERGISIRVAETVLKEGMVAGTVEAGRRPGEWQAKIVHAIRGRRDIGVVVLIIRNNRLKVKTVEWEDWR
jgi:hypothetical protein